MGAKMVSIPPMQLADYLTQHGISDAAFARSIGVERQAVWRYRLGVRFPEKPILLKIFEATEGAVTANDFAGIAPAPHTEAAE